MSSAPTCILVTGANGQVGRELQFLSADFPKFQFLFADRARLDITSELAVSKFFSDNRIGYCINCAAYTAVDKAEADAENAWRTNALGAGLLASACAEHQIPLFHLSSDYVYHNDKNTPLLEGDITSPKGIYAKTKLQGEELVIKHHPGSSMILRTSWVYSSFGSNFVKTMLRLGKERKELGVVFDQIGTPTYARDLARTMLLLIEKVETGQLDKSDLDGVYNYSNEGVASWYDFASAIFELKGLELRLKAIESRDFPTPAERPGFSVLNKRKIKEQFGLVIPHWRESLRRCLEELAT
jgi:dTDP-4-dehydrorhamnose reductase